MINAIRGMNDILPADIPRWRFAEETARRIFVCYGFSELRPPMLERTELFTRGIGEDTDVVEKQMYTFLDKSGASLTLRPEATASVLRAVIEHGLLGKEPIQKLFSIGPMFRYERPQKGRYRQFHQINCERLGEFGPLTDAETLCLAYDIASALGLGGINLAVNSLGCPVCRPSFKQALQAFLETRKATLCEDCVRRMYTNPLRVLDCKADDCKASVRNAPVIEDYLCTHCQEHYEEMLGALTVLAVPYARNPRLVRGLDYYTKTTFEISVAGLGSQNAIAGGGRYDGLIATLGGPDVPGVGFAFGLERVIMLLPEVAEPSKGCFVVALGDSAKKHALTLLAEIRRAGITADAMLEKSFKVQMRHAGKSGYPFCAILGEEELAKSIVTLKDLQTGEQTPVGRDRCIGKIKGLLGQGA